MYIQMVNEIAFTLKFSFFTYFKYYKHFYHPKTVLFQKTVPAYEKLLLLVCKGFRIFDLIRFDHIEHRMNVDTYCGQRAVQRRKEFFRDATGFYKVVINSKQNRFGFQLIFILQTKYKYIINYIRKEMERKKQVKVQDFSQAVVNKSFLPRC